MSKAAPLDRRLNVLHAGTVLPWQEHAPKQLAMSKI
jgi:hypothetical protein